MTNPEMHSQPPQPAEFDLSALANSVRQAHEAAQSDIQVQEGGIAAGGLAKAVEASRVDQSSQPISNEEPVIFNPEADTQQVTEIHNSSDFFEEIPEDNTQETLEKVQKLQSEMSVFRAHIARDYYSDSAYKLKLSQVSQEFFSALTSPNVLEYMSKHSAVALRASGFDMINDALENGDVPSIEQIQALQKLIQSQGIKKIIPKSPVEGQKPSQELVDEYANKPRYINAAGQKLMMYQDSSNPRPSEVLSTDSVAKVLEKCNPESWILSENDRAYYEKVVDSNNNWDKGSSFASPPSKPGIPKTKYAWNRVGFKDSDYYSGEASAPPKNTEQEFATRVKHWWDRSYVSNNIPSSQRKNDQIIISAAANDARQRLILSEELSSTEED